MTRDDIIRMAREAGCTANEANAWCGFLERFAALVAAAAVEREREASAKVCDEEGLLWGQRYAAAIRARGETK